MIQFKVLIFLIISIVLFFIIVHGCEFYLDQITFFEKHYVLANILKYAIALYSSIYFFDSIAEKYTKKK